MPSLPLPKCPLAKVVLTIVLACPGWLGGAGKPGFDTGPFQVPIVDVVMTWIIDSREPDGGYWRSESPYQPTVSDVKGLCQVLTRACEIRRLFPAHYAFRHEDGHLVVKAVSKPADPEEHAPVPPSSPSVRPSVIPVAKREPDPGPHGGAGSGVAMGSPDLSTVKPVATPGAGRGRVDEGVVENLSDLPEDLQRTMRGMKATFPGGRPASVVDRSPEVEEGAPVSSGGPVVPAAIRPPERKGFWEAIKDKVFPTEERRKEQALRKADRALEKKAEVLREAGYQDSPGSSQDELPPTGDFFP